MSLKRMIAVALMVMLLVLSSGSFAETYVFPVEPATPTEIDISMSDAISIAKKEVIQRQGLTLDTIQNYKVKTSFVSLENGEKAWVIMLLSDAMFYGINSSFMISSVDGSIIDYRATDMGLTHDLQELWKKRKGAMGAWSLEDKALFDMLYGSGRNVIPGDEFISQEEAKTIALSILPQSAGSYEFQYSFLHYAGEAYEYVWVVTILVEDKETYQVNLSGIDGTVIDVFDLAKNRG